MCEKEITVRNSKVKLCNPVYHPIRKFTTVLFSVLLCSLDLSSNLVLCMRDTDCLTGASHYLESWLHYSLLVLQLAVLLLAVMDYTVSVSWPGINRVSSVTHKWLMRWEDKILHVLQQPWKLNEWVGKKGKRGLKSSVYWTSQISCLMPQLLMMPFVNKLVFPELDH